MCVAHCVQDVGRLDGQPASQVVALRFGFGAARVNLFIRAQQPNGLDGLRFRLALVGREFEGSGQRGGENVLDEVRLRSRVESDGANPDAARFLGRRSGDELASERKLLKGARISGDRAGYDQGLLLVAQPRVERRRRSGRVFAVDRLLFRPLWQFAENGCRRFRR